MLPRLRTPSDFEPRKYSSGLFSRRREIMMPKTAGTTKTTRNTKAYVELLLSNEDGRLLFARKSGPSVVSRHSPTYSNTHYLCHERKAIESAFRTDLGKSAHWGDQGCYQFDNYPLIKFINMREAKRAAPVGGLSLFQTELLAHTMVIRRGKTKFLGGFSI